MMTFYLMMAIQSLQILIGAAGGTLNFQPIRVAMDHTPLASEVGTSVTVIYTVCNPVPNPDVYSTATVTINVISSCITDLKVLLGGLLLIIVVRYHDHQIV
ncbi:MAG: hypothetical protein IPG00_20635 [Saprospiraceae bacterium]|nr:hypothetical protein [Saprospiraceae bacterium]